jgi:selenide, water dikinase
MNPLSMPLLRDLVLVGGGHAHVLLLRKWGMQPLPGTRVTLINPDPAAPYTGMLPGHIAGHYRRDELMIDLVRLARFAGARLILDAATGIDRQARLIHLKGRPPLAYDIASIDVGITSDVPDLPGFAAHAFAAKPLGAYAAAWEAFLARRIAFPRIVILGAGIAGMELAMASAHRLEATGAKPEITLIERAKTAVPNIGQRARAVLLEEAQSHGIRILTGARATGITAAHVMLEGGESLPSDFTLSAAGSRPHAWLAETGLDLHEGFLATNACLQTSDPAIFAVGDCAHLTESPRPKAGVFAVRAAPILFQNLRAGLRGGTLAPFNPQDDYLKLVSLGGKTALAEKFGLKLQGDKLWLLKDQIDRRFMAKFEHYPEMSAPALPSEATLGLAEALHRQPLCGGCGAKLGPDTLGEALAALPSPRRPEVLSGPGDDAAIIAKASGVQVITTDHLRAFTHDPRLMARIVALHAMGDVWAMGAAPEVALAQITLPPLGLQMQKAMLAEIMQVASETFRQAGADVVGGHSSSGAELTIGFTVTGTAARAITKSGARAGDVLILTKPIGTGTILAAEMAMARIPGLILGEAVAACFASMQRSLGPDAAILAREAHAMTDVTGFGLAGHLIEILEASGVAATIHLADIPFLPGAEALAAMGQGSSLAPENRAATASRLTAPDTAATRLLYDPQTAGGLLAAVAPEMAEQLLSALQAAGSPASVIGHVTEGPPHLTVQA